MKNENQKDFPNRKNDVFNFIAPRRLSARSEFQHDKEVVDDMVTKPTEQNIKATKSYQLSKDSMVFTGLSRCFVEAFGLEFAVYEAELRWCFTTNGHENWSYRTQEMIREQTGLHRNRQTT